MAGDWGPGDPHKPARSEAWTEGSYGAEGGDRSRHEQDNLYHTISKVGLGLDWEGLVASMVGLMLDRGILEQQGGPGEQGVNVFHVSKPFLPSARDLNMKTHRALQVPLRLKLLSTNNTEEFMSIIMDQTLTRHLPVSQ